MLKTMEKARKNCSPVVLVPGNSRFPISREFPGNYFSRFPGKSYRISREIGKYIIFNKCIKYTKLETLMGNVKNANTASTKNNPKLCAMYWSGQYRLVLWFYPLLGSPMGTEKGQTKINNRLSHDLWIMSAFLYTHFHSNQGKDKHQNMVMHCKR